MRRRHRRRHRRRRSCRSPFAALGNMGALSKRNDEPTQASRPFDREPRRLRVRRGRRRSLVVESAEHALDRGAPILAELVGAALTADAYHISAPEPTGRGAAMAMTRAMCAAGVWPQRHRLHRRARHVDAAQRRDRDAGDQGRVRRGRVPRRRSRSPKSMVGHLLGAAGAVSGDRGDRRDPGQGHPADDQPRHPRSGLRPRLRAERPRGRRASTRRWSTASASAARTRWRSSAGSSPRPRDAGARPASAARPRMPRSRAGSSCGSGIGRSAA